MYHRTPIANSVPSPLFAQYAHHVEILYRSQREFGETFSRSQTEIGERLEDLRSRCREIEARHTELGGMYHGLDHEQCVYTYALDKLEKKVRILTFAFVASAVINGILLWKYTRK
jgi:hypothetical protein